MEAKAKMGRGHCAKYLYAGTRYIFPFPGAYSKIELRGTR